MSVLTFKQVTKTFQDGHHEINALKATDFSIEAGEFVAIIVDHQVLENQPF